MCQEIEGGQTGGQTGSQTDSRSEGQIREIAGQSVNQRGSQTSGQTGGQTIINQMRDEIRIAQFLQQVVRVFRLLFLQRRRPFGRQ